MASKQGRELRFAAKQEKRHVEKKVIGKSKVKATKQSDKEFREMKCVRARVCLVEPQGPLHLHLHLHSPCLHPGAAFNSQFRHFICAVAYTSAGLCIAPTLDRFCFAITSFNYIRGLQCVVWRMVGWFVGL